MSPEIIPPADDPIVEDDPPEPPAARRGGMLTCEFCECRLDSQGKVLRRGKVAKELTDAEETIESLTRELAKAREALTAAQQDIAALREANRPPDRKRSFWEREV